MPNPLRHSLRVLLKYRLYTGFALIGLSVAPISMIPSTPSIGRSIG